MSAFQPPARDEKQPVFFPCWNEALQRAAVSAAQREGYRRGILAFLRHCKIWRAPATIMLVKQYLAEREGQGTNGAREARFAALLTQDRRTPATQAAARFSRCWR